MRLVFTVLCYVFTIYLCSIKYRTLIIHTNQRWSPRGRPWPRGQILKSLALALASKVKSLALALASRPQVLENWPVFGSRTALFFGKLKFCGAVEKIIGKRFYRGDRSKNFCEDLFFFFWRALALVSLVLGLGLEHSCPWPRECLSSERLSLALALASDFFCVLGLGLEPCVLDSSSDTNTINLLSSIIAEQNQSERDYSVVRFAKFFFLPWFCRFITSHPVSRPSVSYSALNFDLIRSIHRQLGTMVLGKVRLLLSCG